MANKGLGSKGMDLLFPEAAEVTADGEQVVSLSVKDVLPDQGQNRTVFDEEGLKELSESIRAHGVIQPLIVRPIGNGSYQLIAGERRLRAAKLAGLETVPAILREVSDRDAAEMALIENLQREDLNPIDEANGFEKLIRQFGITQEEAAARVGRSRTAVTNSLRLLSLPDSAKNLLRDGVITAGHARALLSLKDEDRITDALCVIIDRGLSVRETEALVKGKSIESKKKAPPKTDEVMLEHYRRLSSAASVQLGRKFNVTPDGKGAGKIVLEYFDTEDLEELLTLLCGEDFLLNQ